MKDDLKGLYAALLVPFDEQGNIIESGLREVVRNAIDTQQLDGLYVNGSSGENFLMNTEQKKDVFRIVKDEAQNDVRLIAQVGSLDLNEAIVLGQYATELGYDALSAVTPFYYPFTFEEIRDYYFKIIEATQNDMIIYAIPGLTGVNITIEQFDTLFKNERIIGVKYTAPDFFLLERLRHAFPDKLIFSGFDEMLVQAAISGVDGAIGSTYNINGVRAQAIFKAAQSGNVEKAYQLQRESNDIIEQVLNPTLKAILKEKGIETGYPKAPFHPFNEALRPQLETLVRTYHL
ncbi:N-acetylneuraminate lyase [Staphylococcus agnetis]|uniref:N-acetylneuraminate lyase n=1 Tax=Staphylococcus agnetis TaxID=985762 RepID=UPI00208EE86B|nr:N-acetylneuraminate lyase [Staphylococcus agnetis]MCO4344961.1 N-acetylneuraminate lyase [Staphylococcus agnetis]MCO4354428.1 N-acetylneuraminate lyase [Staphylococcus agnetis]MCO4359192.1 N-acetylneuraminate lyase [Staphylococcus agnetis]MCO4364017.1 N-acetylneuraminate lyase [Staphylococcus agnetis]MCO4370984.1 N-acetylneuraminate lyase [Staphylococcus agnetis]